jgi:hypothetical protein
MFRRLVVAVTAGLAGAAAVAPVVAAPPYAAGQPARRRPWRERR